MKVNKFYTNLQQSKKLAEILPIESADMEYMFLKDGSKVSDVPFVKDGYEESDCCYNFISCWSLVALLDVLLNPKVFQVVGGNWYCECWKNPKDVKDDESTYIRYTKANNPIDACYEMILILHKLNLL